MTAPVYDTAPAGLLTELARLGVRLKLVGADRIEVMAPEGSLSGELRERIVREKPAIIDWLTRAAAVPELSEVVARPFERYEPFPASDLQVSFLMGSRAGFEYHVRPHQYMEFDFAELEPARFTAALNRALHRHRDSIVVVRDDLSMQTVRDPAPMPVGVSDLTGLTPDEAEAELGRIRAGMEREELPLDRWPWLHMHISLLPGGRARLHYNHNNFFSDALGTGRLLESVLRLYEAPETGLVPLTVAYRDCVLTLAEIEDGPLGERSRRYWHERLAGWPEAPGLPLVTGADARGRSRLTRRELLLPAQPWQAVKQAAARHGLTPTSVLLAVYAEVIAYWSGSRHFLLNNMITHRLPIHPQIGEVIGNFASLYPLEVDWRADEPFHARALRLQRQLMADIRHVHYSGVKVLQALNQVRGTPGRAPLPFAAGSALVAGQALRPVHSVLETPQVLLDAEFFELRDGRFWMVWDVIEAMFPAGLIDAAHDGYRRALRRLADEPGSWQEHAFDLLPADQRAERERLNRPAGAPEPGLLGGVLDAAVATRPGAIAVIGDSTLTYQDLDRESRRLAGLLRERGARPDTLVAVLLPDGAAQVPAVFAALRAGAAYVPIDPRWPDERVRYLLAETGATAVVTTGALRQRLDGAGVPVVEVDSADQPAQEPPEPGGDPGDLAYVIYTSGSTGRPKGAMLDHRGPLNTIRDINRTFAVGADDVLLSVSSLCFDLSVYDVFGAAAAGATLVRPTGAADPAAWLRLLGEHSVTVWNSVPALMELVTDEAVRQGVRLSDLRLVLLSGDWIPVELPGRIREVAPNAKVVSLGGATEASIWSITYPIETVDPEWVSIPYGRPMANQTWHVLDPAGRDAPTWTTGELYIGGVGVAQGYLGDPERSAASFVAHPRTGERLYRTGDLGRYLPGGDIEFLGRADFQVKINGFRVEPGEVEQALLGHPGVRQAAVVARTASSGRQLAGFVVTSPGGPDQNELRAYLADRLPGHLVPSYLSVLDRLPLSGNGKLDRGALRTIDPPGRDGDRPFTAPRTPTETVLAEVWREVLAGGPIGVHDDFFAIGGQSFAALRVVGLAAERLGRPVPLGALLERRTIAGLAEAVDAPAREWSPLVRLDRDGEGSPWFLAHPAGGTVFCYHDLAGLLGTRCYGFQAPGPGNGQPALDRIEDLAGLYLPRLLAAQPQGPYRLGGWSSGALVAFELARRLEQRGQRVSDLVVIDSPAPGAASATGPDEADLVAWFLEDMGVDPATPFDGLHHSLPDLTPAALEATWAIFRGVVTGAFRYAPSRIDAAITVLRATGGTVSEFAGHPFHDAPHWGWAELTSGPVRCHAVPGTHHTLLGPGTVADVAAAFPAA